MVEVAILEDALARDLNWILARDRHRSSPWDYFCQDRDIVKEDGWDSIV